jgi:acyl-coenzyme A thioesterase PaaI-like protein
LADAVGGLAVSLCVEKPTPTIDIQIDYLAPATRDIFAEGNVRRTGDSVGVADIDTFHVEGDMIATGRGVFISDGGPAQIPPGAMKLNKATRNLAVRCSPRPPVREG